MGEETRIELPEKELQRPMTVEEINYLVLASIEQIRINRFNPVSMFEMLEDKPSTDEDNIDFPMFKPGYLYIITNICGVDDGTATTYTRMGYTSGGQTHWLYGAVPSAAGLPITWTGQVICIEGDQIRVAFKGGTADDVIKATVDGYKIKI